MASKPGIDDPYLPLGIGVMLQIAGGIAWAVTDSDVIESVALIVCAVGGMFLLVGLVGVGVLIGGRALDRERKV